MEVFWKCAAAILLAVILELALKKQEKDVSTVLTAAVIVMAAAASLKLLEPVLSLLHRLRQVGNLEENSLSVLLKAAGLGLAAETAGFVCSDAGNEALGRLVRFLGTAAILCLSVPLFSGLLDCVLEMVGGS